MRFPFGIFIYFCGDNDKFIQQWTLRMTINFIKSISSILIWSLSRSHSLPFCLIFLFNRRRRQQRLKWKSWMEFFRMTSYRLLHFAYVCFFYISSVLLLLLKLMEYVKCLRLQRFVSFARSLFLSLWHCLSCRCRSRSTVFFFYIYLLLRTKPSNSLYFAPLRIHDAYILLLP